MKQSTPLLNFYVCLFVFLTAAYRADLNISIQKDSFTLNKQTGQLPVLLYLVYPKN